jgi:hypothetical protein
MVPTGNIPLSHLHFVLLHGLLSVWRYGGEGENGAMEGEAHKRSGIEMELGRGALAADEAGFGR